jgi:hypothetical protein
MQTTTGFARSSSTHLGNSSSRPRTTRPSGHGISPPGGVSRCSKRTVTLSRRWHGVEPRLPPRRRREGRVPCRTEREALRTARVRQRRRRWSMSSRVVRSTRLSRCVNGRRTSCRPRTRPGTESENLVRADLAPLSYRVLTRTPASARPFTTRATFVFPPSPTLAAMMRTRARLSASARLDAPHLCIF